MEVESCLGVQLLVHEVAPKAVMYFVVIVNGGPVSSFFCHSYVVKVRVDDKMCPSDSGNISVLCACS